MIKNSDLLAHTASPTATSPERLTLLAPRALYLDVAERLRQQIFSRVLQPGDWIDEQKLSLDFGISRTPLREALKVLAAEGLVTMKVRRGAYVTEMSRDDVVQVYHLLALLESDAARTIAGMGDATALERLQTIHERLEKQVKQRELFFATNEEFHLALMELAGNRWALQTVRDLRKVMKLNRHQSLLRQGRITDSLKEHRALMGALRSGQAGAAARLMQGHFASGLEAAV